MQKTKLFFLLLLQHHLQQQLVSLPCVASGLSRSWDRPDAWAKGRPTWRWLRRALPPGPPLPPGSRQPWRGSPRGRPPVRRVHRSYGWRGGGERSWIRAEFGNISSAAPKQRHRGANLAATPVRLLVQRSSRRIVPHLRGTPMRRVRAWLNVCLNLDSSE